MKQCFFSFGDIYNYYLFIKADLRSVKPIIPRPENMDIKAFNTLASISTKEEKLCFVGDVELFLNNKLFPWESKMLEILYTNPSASFQQVFNWFSHNYQGRHHRQFKNRQDVYLIYRNVRDMGQVYFEGKCYIKGDRGKRG